jgi:hypothetical protein
MPPRISRTGIIPFKAMTKALHHREKPIMPITTEMTPLISMDIDPTS